MGKIFGLDGLEKKDDAVEKARRQLEEVVGKKVTDEELVEYCKDLVRRREEEKRIKKETQAIYAKVTEECKDPAKFFEDLARSFLNNPAHAQLKYALGVLLYARQHHHAELDADSDLVGGDICFYDPKTIAYELVEAILKETPKDFTNEFQEKMREASHHKLGEWMKELRQVTHERYKGGRPKKAELVEKGFTPSELDMFFSVVDDPEAKRCYLVMATLGLRLGELCRLKGSDYNPETKELRIPSAKGSYNGVVRLPGSIARIIPEKKPDEPLFNRTYKQLRDRFAFYRERAGLTDVYMYSEPCGAGKGTRNRMYRLTCHSLRHYAIQRFYRMCKDVDLTRRFARHKHSNTTAVYLQSSRKKEVEALLEQMDIVTALSRSESVS